MEYPFYISCSNELAMVSIPKQKWCEPYDWQTALTEGTIFPCLNLTFYKAPEGKSTCKTCNSLSGKKQKTREELMSQITAISFAINDLTLYLDTHPDCPKGLALFYHLYMKTLLLNRKQEPYMITCYVLLTIPMLSLH